MEKNEKNIQNQEQRKKKGISIPVTITILILTLIIGISIGYILSKNEKQTNNHNAEQSQNTAATDKNSSNTQTNIKINNDKEYIYDNIEYSSTKANKHVKRADGEYDETVKESYDSSKELVIPYININSQDAKNVNEEMITLYNKAYDQFKDEFSAANIKYDTYYYKNTVSIVIDYSPFPICPIGAPANEIYMYTFYLDTGRILTTSEIYDMSTFKGDKEKISTTIKNISDSESYDLEKGWEPVALDNNGNLIVTATYFGVGAKQVIVLK